MISSADTRVPARTHERYSTVAIALHWLIAAGIGLQMLLGWRLEDFDGFPRSTLLQIHKSVGISILVLTAARLAWRLVNPPPPQPTSFTPLERHLSHWAHVGFYIVLLALPLTGWALVSAGRPGGMKLFSVIPWPSLPLMSLLPGDVQDALADVFANTHAALVWVMLALLALHLAGALKHHFISRDPTISRMAPGARPGALLEPRLIAVVVLFAAFFAAVYLPPPARPKPRPRPASLAQADIYLDVIGPSLDRRCGSCHSDDEARGGLSVAGADSLFQGGSAGPVIVPGDPGKSLLWRRVTLPHDDAKYMPKDGKPPLNVDQLAALKLWIAIGAPRSGPVAALNLTGAQKAVLQAAVDSVSGGGDAGANGGATTGPALPVVPAADPAALHHLEDLGFVARPVSKTSQLLVVDFTSHRALNDGDFDALAKVALQVRILNLRDGQLADGSLRRLQPFANLAQLRLDDNPVTDAGLADLQPLTSLAYLNLVGSKVTDAGLGQLDRLSKLQRIYLWGTAVTPAGVDKLKVAHPGAFVYAGVKPADVPKEPKMAPVN